MLSPIKATDVFWGLNPKELIFQKLAFQDCILPIVLYSFKFLLINLIIYTDFLDFITRICIFVKNFAVFCSNGLSTKFLTKMQCKNMTYLSFECIINISNKIGELLCLNWYIKTEARL